MKIKTTYLFLIVITLVVFSYGCTNEEVDSIQPQIEETAGKSITTITNAEELEEEEISKSGILSPKFLKGLD